MHRRLAAQRVNRVNLRREFFSATPHDALVQLRDLAGDVLQFTELPEVLEYRQSVNLRTAERSVGQPSAAVADCATAAALSATRSGTSACGRSTGADSSPRSTVSATEAIVSTAWVRPMPHDTASSAKSSPVIRSSRFRPATASPECRYADEARNTGAASYKGATL